MEMQGNVRHAKKKSYQDILTASPYLESLREKEMNKKAEELRKSKRKTVTKKFFDDSDSDEPFNTSDTDDSDCPCLFCNELYSNSKAHEGWLCCQKCHRWAHAGVLAFLKGLNNSFVTCVLINIICYSYVILPYGVGQDGFLT